MRTDDQIIAILEQLDPEIYELTRISAEEVYRTGHSANMRYAVAESGLSEEEILIAW